MERYKTIIFTNGKKNCERVVNNVTEEVKNANIFGQHCFS